MWGHAIAPLDRLCDGLLISVFQTVCLKRAGITGGLQLMLIAILRRTAGPIKAGHVAPGIMVSAVAVAIGLLNAVSISY